MDRPLSFLEKLGKERTDMNEKEILKLLKGQQLSLKALLEKAECFTSHDKEEMENQIATLMDEGYIGKKNSFYYLLQDDGSFLAKVTMKNRNFVILTEMVTGEEHKISGYESDQLLVGDLVYAREFQKNIFHCTEYYKPTTSLKGYYSLDRSGTEIMNVEYLTACGKKVVIKDVEESLKGQLNQGDLIEGEIVSFNGNVIAVKVTSLLVKADDVGADISMLIAEEGAPLSFPEGVMEEARNMPKEVSAQDKEGRKDFTEDCVVTIDGDDSHDFDDAVFATRLGGGYQITVHIADVTEYVKPGHPLDNEAISRGTSIYVADRVVPMLPFELSNGICSLNPEVERLTLSVVMDVDAKGNVFHTEVYRGVIRSHARLTYSKVNAFFKGEEVDFSKEVKDVLEILHEASLKIRNRRTLQGAMKLDSTELKFHLDETGMPVEVIKCTQGPSEKMIEDLMILANCAVATLLRQHDIPVLYRVHENPPMEKLSLFRDYLKKVHLLKTFPKTENLSGARLNDFLASIEDSNLRESVSYMMLRALAKARYSPEEIGHFGLAEMEYCHFTSPIRRYPDDIIHRLVKDYIIDQKTVDYEEVYSYLEKMGNLCSSEEVRADKISRECDDLESAKYMSQHIGEVYHAKVTGMVGRGMFVETELGIEGFVPYYCLHSDYFHFDEKAFAVLGKETEDTYTIGTPLMVAVLSSNPKTREIEFCTPEFFRMNCVDLSDEEREDLAKNGITYYREDNYRRTSGRYFDEGVDEMSDITKEENLAFAMNQMEEKDEKIKERRAEREDDGFRPSPEQWKEVDVIRAVLAKYPDDEEKVIQVLSVMDIDEEEYCKLLRFTKPREDKGSKGRRPSRGGSSFGGRSGRSGGRSSGRSFGHSDRSHGGDRGERRGGFGHSSKDGFSKSSRFGGSRGRSSDSKFSRGGDAKGFKRGSYSHDRDNGRFSRSETKEAAPRKATRSGYGKRSRGE